MKKMLFVMNPFSGLRKAPKVLTEIITIFNRAGYMVNTYMTKAPFDGEEVVAEYAKDMDLVVCCGGDGTFNETVSGILKSGADVPVGYIPAGSTNDFANSLHLPLTILNAAREIVEGTAQPLDLGRFGDRYFSYVASFGAFTKVSYATPQSVKNTLGHAAYVFSGIAELPQIKSIPVKIEIDGEVYEDEYIFGAICNCTSMGGIISLKPELVDMQDGLFEILLVRAPKNVAELTECIAAINRKDCQCRMMTFLSGKKIKVEMGEAVDWSLDGEKADGIQSVEIENIHHAYRLVKRVEEA